METPQRARRSWNDNELFSVEAKLAGLRKSSLRRQQQHSKASKADMMSKFANCRNFDPASLDPKLLGLLGVEAESLRRDAAAISDFFGSRFELEQEALGLAHELLAKGSPFLNDPTLLELGLGDAGLGNRHNSPPATPVKDRGEEAKAPLLPQRGSARKSSARRVWTTPLQDEGEEAKSSPVLHRGSARRSSFGPKTGPGCDSGHAGFDAVRRRLVLEPLAK